MWRACVLAAAMACGAPDVLACADPYNIQGIVYDDVPAGTPSSAIILDVEFEPAALDQWRGGVIEARVRRIVQGNFTGERVRVGIINSSCLYPFQFGTEGLIIGSVNEGFETFSLQARRWPDLAPVTSEFGLGFEGAWFQPKAESIRERRDRTGADPLASTLDGTPIDGAQSAYGDFDGDGAQDTASFFEDEDGNLVVAVAQASNAQDMAIIWGGDISSLPRFAIRAAPPRLYHTDCEAYGPDCGGAPAHVNLTHDGIIVEGLEDHSRTLYYWSDGEFKNVSVRE